jgi:hypothetical protein
MERFLLDRFLHLGLPVRLVENVMGVLVCVLTIDVSVTVTCTSGMYSAVIFYIVIIVLSLVVFELHYLVTLRVFLIISQDCEMYCSAFCTRSGYNHAIDLPGTGT